MQHLAIHGDQGRPTIIGENVTIGHGAIVHATHIGDYVIVGMNASILDEAVVGSGSIIGANALVTSGMTIPEGSLVLGVPARIVKRDDPSLRDAAKRNAEEYAALKDAHTRGEFVRYQS